MTSDMTRTFCLTHLPMNFMLKNKLHNKSLVVFKLFDIHLFNIQSLIDIYV